MNNFKKIKRIVANQYHFMLNINIFILWMNQIYNLRKHQWEASFLNIEVCMHKSFSIVYISLNQRANINGNVEEITQLKNLILAL